MNKKLFSVLLATLLVISLSIPASAATPTLGDQKTWDYGTNTSYGTYVPYKGSAQATFYNAGGSEQNYAKTYCSFTLNSTNVSNIISYNNGTNSAESGKNLYLTLDITNIPSTSSGYDQMDAYAISTSLPNPKSDLENDDVFGTRNEEAEITALGTVSATTYSMSVMWYDYRDGDASDNGKWQCQFCMSGQYVKVLGQWIPSFGDYNTVRQSSAIQATLPYSKNGGTK